MAIFVCVRAFCAPTYHLLATHLHVAFFVLGCWTYSHLAEMTAAHTHTHRHPYPPIPTPACALARTHTRTRIPTHACLLRCARCTCKARAGPLSIPFARPLARPARPREASRKFRISCWLRLGMTKGTKQHNGPITTVNSSSQQCKFGS